MSGATAAEIIRALRLEPHPEGGHYREIHRDPDPPGGRGAVTSIYYLLEVGEVSAWHRVDAVEIWSFHAGDPLVITISENGHDAASYQLGPDVARGQHPQVVVPKGAWQTAESLGRWTLVGCVVAPAFRFEGFELAAPDWRPRPRNG
jgi:predicted cupin superfamily sugar epimerase